jgi:hypothetical protein
MAYLFGLKHFLKSCTKLNKFGIFSDIRYFIMNRRSLYTIVVYITLVIFSYDVNAQAAGYKKALACIHTREKQFSKYSGT